MNVILVGILALRRMTGNNKGVAIVTQPLTSIMNDKLKNNVAKTAVLSMRGKLRNDGADVEEEVELSCLEADVLDGNYPVLLGHPESWGSARGQQLLLEMKKRDMILLIAIDEFHQGQVGHWQEFRPDMMKINSRLRVFRSPGAPTIAMSATASHGEVMATISNLGFRTKPVLLQASPTQPNIKFVTMQRPPNNYGPDGYEDKNGIHHNGYLSDLKEVYLREFIKSVQEGRPVKKGLIFCR